MKFCCERFEMHYFFPDNYGMNIRIVKYAENELLDKRNLYRFYITQGYALGQTNVSNLNVGFCPFCGENLFKFYKSDHYVNEKPGYF